MSLVRNMWHSYEIRHGNVQLRPLQEEDIEYLRQWRNNKAESKYLSSIGYITTEAQRAWFQECMESDDNITFGIIDLDRNVFVGSIALYNFDDDQAELGRLMIGDPEAHGRHLGRNAVEGLSDLAFSKLRVNKLILHVYKDNTPAVTIYKQAGYIIVDEYQASDGKIEVLMERSCSS